MKKLSILLVFAYLFIGHQASAQGRQPNIIFFFIDDMGWMDTSVPFGDSLTALNRRYHTPNMERLARQGMKFTQAYSTPVCTPTRTSFLTGMNVLRHRVTNWTSTQRDNPTDQPDEEFTLADWNYNGFSGTRRVAHAVSATPLPELLKEGGYYTIHVGKAHWAPYGTPGANPTNLGFLVNVAGHAAGQPQSYEGKDNYGNIPGKAGAQAIHDLPEFYGSDTFLTEALTLKAIQALEDPIARKRPFFLHMAHYAVHTPIQADKRFVQKYLDAGLPVTEANYASLVEGMDKSLGDLMDFLEAKGLAQNTIILFMSDNGGLSLSYARGGGAHTQNLPLRAGKGSVYEGGIREPMLVKWPGVVKPASVSRQPVIIEDFFPTILEMAGIQQAKTLQQVDGRSFVPVLRQADAKLSERPLVWHLPNKWIPEDGPGINYHSALRMGDWKLVYSMRHRRLELYHLQQDLGEQKDLAAQYPDRVKQMARQLTTILKAAQTPMPAYKSNGRPVPWPDEFR